MNLKLPIKIANAQLANLLQYAKDSGYEVAKKHLGDLITYTIDHPRYDDTPLAESCQDERHRWAHFTYLRLEKAGEATDWKAAFKELRNLTLAVNKGPPVPDLEVDIRSIVKAHTRGNVIAGGSPRSSEDLNGVTDSLDAILHRLTSFATDAETPYPSDTISLDWGLTLLKEINRLKDQNG